MSFYEVFRKMSRIDLADYLKSVSISDVEYSLKKNKLSHFDLLNLLSKSADSCLDQMACKANSITNRYFGKTILLYSPLYLSNYCSNQCVYCGFNRKNSIKRKKLTFEEIEEEAAKIKENGIEHILILTGEDKSKAGFEYIKDSIKILKKYFHSISIEVYPMSTTEYIELTNLGVDGLTVYQEVYDEKIYDELHISGHKKDYRYRLETPERGAEAGFRTVNIGSLIGLGRADLEIFYTALHADYLSKRYLNTEFSISFPRLNEYGIDFVSKNSIDDRTFFKLLMAVRIYLPRLGITISTREPAGLRDKIIYLGATKLSAGSCTSVGGYSHLEESDEQFQISDTRTVKQISDMLKTKNYQPVLKDWEIL